MSKKQLTYGDKDIQTLGDFEWIRLRPTNHIPDTHVDGQTHIIKEIFDNALDETELFPNGRVDMLLFLDSNKNTYQVVITDNGRGVPLGKLKDSFTNLKTSGKYDKASYAGLSGGLNGIGGKVAVALSENFKVVTMRDNQVGHLCFRKSELGTESITDYPSETTGTLVALEPLKDFFTGVDVFIESGYEKLSRLALLLSMFSKNTHITIRVVYKSIDKKFWEMNGPEAVQFISWKYNDSAVTLVDGQDSFTTMKYLKELWDVQSRFIWQLEHVVKESSWVDPKSKETVILNYDINMYLPKIYRSLQVSSIVNNIPMKDTNSSHITILLSTVKTILKDYIETPEIQTYFEENYKFPLCFAISLKYSDVQFTSLSKDGFKNLVFEEYYGKLLLETLSTYSEEVWRELYQFLEQDIILKYHLYYNKPLTSKSAAKKLSLELKDRQFYDCSTPNRQEAELIIVEGVSASHVKLARDPRTQAVFMIRGKPLNVHKTDKTRPDTISRLKSYPAYLDLMKILNIQPGQTDISTANYGKIILMQDADVDGGHIRALHIGALHEINPLILSSGMVYLANPPLYEVLLDEKSDKKKFIRSKKDLIAFRIACLYQPTFSIKVGDIHNKVTPVQLKNNDFLDFCSIITVVGEMFDELSKRLVIPTLILEKLSHLSAYIQPGRVDVEMLRQMFGRGTVFNMLTGILTIANGEVDVSFSLNGVVDALYEELMGILYKLDWKNLKILLTTNFTDTYSDTHVSIVQLYNMFEMLNNKLYVQRHKGLGGVEKDDLRPTCMDPNTRFLHQITSIGDLDRILSLLGDDTAARRQILEDYQLLNPKK